MTAGKVVVQEPLYGDPAVPLVRYAVPVVVDTPLPRFSRPRTAPGPEVPTPVRTFCCVSIVPLKRNTEPMEVLGLGQRGKAVGTNGKTMSVCAAVSCAPAVSPASLTTYPAKETTAVG